MQVEVIRADLRLLESEDNKVIILKNAIKEGIESGIAANFNPKKHLESLKAEKEMSKYFLSNIVVDDLTKIWDYTYEVCSENQADK